MEYGPCGGVEFDGSCEVSAHACVFLDVGVVRWRGDGDVPGEVAEARAVTTDRGDAVSAAGERRPETGLGVDGVAARAGRGIETLIRERQVVVADFPARALDV